MYYINRPKARVFITLLSGLMGISSFSYAYNPLTHAVKEAETLKWFATNKGYDWWCGTSPPQICEEIYFFISTYFTYDAVSKDTHLYRYFQYGAVFPDIPNNLPKGKSSLIKMRQFLQDLDAEYNLPSISDLNSIPSMEGFRSHSIEFAIHLVGKAFEGGNDMASLEKKAFALGYISHIIEDLIAKTFYVPRKILETDIGEINMLSGFYNDLPGVEIETIVQNLVDSYWMYVSSSSEKERLVDELMASFGGDCLYSPHTYCYVWSRTSRLKPKTTMIYKDSQGRIKFFPSAGYNSITETRKECLNDVTVSYYPMSTHGVSHYSFDGLDGWVTSIDMTASCERAPVFDFLRAGAIDYFGSASFDANQLAIMAESAGFMRHLMPALYGTKGFADALTLIAQTTVNDKINAYQFNIFQFVDDFLEFVTKAFISPLSSLFVGWAIDNIDTWFDKYCFVSENRLREILLFSVCKTDSNAKLSSSDLKPALTALGNYYSGFNPPEYERLKNTNLALASNYSDIYNFPGWAHMYMDVPIYIIRDICQFLYKESGIWKSVSDWATNWPNIRYDKVEKAAGIGSLVFDYEGGTSHNTPISPDIAVFDSKFEKYFIGEWIEAYKATSKYTRYRVSVDYLFTGTVNTNSKVVMHLIADDGDGDIENDVIFKDTTYTFPGSRDVYTNKQGRLQFQVEFRPADIPEVNWTDIEGVYAVMYYQEGTIKTPIFTTNPHIFFESLGYTSEPYLYRNLYGDSPYYDAPTTNWPYSLKIDISSPTPCPFVYSFNGSEYVEDNNILAASEIDSCEVTEYYRLEQTPAKEQNRYLLQIREFEQEHTYLDKIELLAIDHTCGVKVGVTTEGDFVVYGDELLPIACVDTLGQSHLGLILERDSTYFQGFPGDELVIDFGEIEVNSEDVLHFVIVDKPPGPQPEASVMVSVYKDGDWHRVGRLLHRRNWWSQMVYPLEEGSLDSLKIKLTWYEEQKLDYVALAKAESEQFITKKCLLVSAVYSNVGSVLPKLLVDDENYAELLPGDTITLEFTVVDIEPGWVRDFVFVSNGYYITETGGGGAQTAYSNIPLIHSLSLYPNPARNDMTIRFGIPKEERVSLKVYDVSGREVKTLMDDRLEAGYHTIRLDGKNLPSGIYFARLITDGFEATKKMVLVR
ncbi:MAG: T9SS type A sorting domain-containing protein [candidate division WOR-3 bacterium]|nr:T9SS type A sorting domain-containing protein [candidate division WOR-3 bacterium]